MKKLPDPSADTPTMDQLRQAFAGARADTEGRWGTMDCAQMIWHCRGFIDLYLGRVPVALPVRLLARVFGPFFLRRTITKSPIATPKNLTTIPAIRATGTDGLDFDQERERLLRALDEVEALTGIRPHPLYGSVVAEDVVALVRHHTAHHANQFGLLPD